jgi:hypothetical protein
MQLWDSDVLTTCQPSTVWCSRERLPAAAAQPSKFRQSCSATDLLFYYLCLEINLVGRRIHLLIMRSFSVYRA